MHIHGVTSGIHPAPASQPSQTAPLDSSLISELGGVDGSDDPLDAGDQTAADEAGSGNPSSGDAPSNPYAQALAAASVLPIADAAGPGPAKIESFSATGNPVAATNSAYAAITDGLNTLAVVDSAGNVSVRAPAAEEVRDAMAQLSSPADRANALAELLGGTVQLAGDDSASLSTGLQALSQGTGQPAGGTASVPPLASMTSDVSPSELQQTDSQFEALFDGAEPPEQILKEITSDGMDGYWKEELKQITDQVANEVLAEKGLTQEQVEKMPPNERIQIEKEIIQEVERRVKELVKEQMKKQQADHNAAKAPQAVGGTQAAGKKAAPELAIDPTTLAAAAPDSQGQSGDSSITALLIDGL